MLIKQLKDIVGAIYLVFRFDYTEFDYSELIYLISLWSDFASMPYSLVVFFFIIFVSVLFGHTEHQNDIQYTDGMEEFLLFYASCFFG